MPESYSLGPEAIRQIRQLVRNETLRATEALKNPLTSAGTRPQTIYIGYAPNGISGRSGTTPGVATDVLVKEIPDTTLQTATSTAGNDLEVTAYNLSPNEIAADGYVSLTQELATGRLIAATIGGGGLKTFCWFTADGAFAISDETFDADIEDQWGYGEDHTTTNITVYNLPTSTASTYEYYGDDGDWGTACYDPDSDTWVILNMECP